MRLIVDGNNLAHRCYKTTGHLANKKGVKTGTAFGVFKSLSSIVHKLKPSELIICWDDRSKYRKDIYPDYKAHREAKRKAIDFDIEDLHREIDKTVEFLSTIGLKQIKLKYFEADDIITYLAKECPSIILSNDKDFFQLINKNISLYRPADSTMYDYKNLESKLKLNQKQHKQYLMMVGDSSDNIKGIKGLGDKTARKILEEYNDLETFYKKFPKLDKKPKAYQELYNNKELMKLNKKLIDLNTAYKKLNAIITDRIIDKNMIDKSIKDMNKFKILCRKYGYSSILQDINFYWLPYRKMALRKKP